jgi:hypothetical protein
MKAASIAESHLDFLEPMRLIRQRMRGAFQIFTAGESR